jgi:7 transmembrane receptor (rhodopsin family)
MNSTTNGGSQPNSTSIVTSPFRFNEANNQISTHTYVVGTALIVKSTLFYFMIIISLFGNSLVLAAIRTTPNFWTKTNKLLASLTVADLSVAVFANIYIPYTLVTSVINNPCSYNVANVATRWMFMLPPFATSCNLIIVAIDRYVAIIHPLQYETKMTDAVVNWMIAGAWLFSFALAMGNTFFLINADLTKCVIIPSAANFQDAAVYILVAAVVLFVYARILHVAWRQHVAIGLTTVVSASGTATVVENQEKVRDSTASFERNQNYVCTFERLKTNELTSYHVAKR